MSPLQVHLQQLQVRDGSRGKKDGYIQMKSEMGQNCNQGVAAWTDAQQHRIGAKGEDAKSGNVHTEDHLV